MSCTDGGLHIEISMLKVIGDWLDGSGWIYVMTSATVTTEGCATGLQKCSHTSRGQWAYQVMAITQYVLLHRSYTMMNGVSRWVYSILTLIMVQGLAFGTPLPTIP